MELCSRSLNIDRLFRKDFLIFSHYIQPKRKDSITIYIQPPITMNDHLITLSDTILLPEAASLTNNREIRSLLQYTQFHYMFSHFCILKTDFYTLQFINLWGHFNSNITMVCTFTKVQWFICSLSSPRGPSRVVGVATGYGLDGPGIDSRWERDFPYLSRPALGPTQPPVQ